MIRSIPVDLGARAYEVLLGPGLLEDAGARLRPLARRDRVAVVSDQTVWGLHGPRLTAALERAGLAVHPVVLPPGEQTKSFSGLETLCDSLLGLELDRGDLIVAFGGGVIGDLAGFAAAIYKRGADFVQIPTTLLAQVDSSVGGKTAIDTPRGKNLIGAFHQPRLVLVDPSLLATLPEREFRAGMAEVIKYGVIGDTPLFSDLESAAQRDPAGGLASLAAVGPSLLQRLLERSAAAKARVVAADEREGGLRAILNYGHTLGHVVETLTGYGTYLHGEAVALGMLAAGEIARVMGLWGDGPRDRQRAVVEATGLPLNWPRLDGEAVIACLQSDKKVRDGRVRFVLPTSIGAVEIRNDVSPATILEALEALPQA